MLYHYVKRCIANSNNSYVDTKSHLSTETVCSVALCDNSDLQPLIAKDVLVELMKSATSSVDFSFNNAVYKANKRSIRGIITCFGFG